MSHSGSKIAARRVAFALALLPLVARAGEEARGKPELGETIEVMGPKARSSGTNVGASAPDDAALAARRATASDAADLLRGVPGVSLAGAGGISSLPAVHGLSDDRLRIQVDGADLMPACPNHMNSALSYADPTRIESVTVFSGITPVSVGGDSIGGSIQVKSARPEFATADRRFVASGVAGAFYRSNGDALGYDLGATAASERLSLTFRQSDSRSDNYRAAGAFKPVAPGTEGGDPIPGDEVASSSYHGALKRSLSLALRAREHLVQLEASQQKVGFEGFPNQRMDMTANDNRVFTLRYTGAFRRADVEARLDYQDTTHEMNMGPDRYSYGTGMPMNTEAETWSAALRATLRPSAGHVVRVGAEYQYHTLYDFWPPVGGTMGPNTFWNVDFGQRRRLDAYAEWERRWSDAWLGQVGIRSDTVMTDAGPVQGYNDALDAWGLDAASFNAASRRRTDQNWDLSALARYRPDPAQTYEGGLARKSRSPNLYQRFAWSTNSMAALMNNLVGDGNGYVGNLELRPEVAHTASVTGDWHDPERQAWGVKATAYYSHVDDFIDARRCDFGQCSPANASATNTFVILQYANRTARLYGLDLSARRLLAQGDHLGSLAAELVLDYVRGQNASDGDGLYGIMPPSATLALVHVKGGWTGSAELRAVAEKTHLSRVRDEIPTGAYAVVDLRASYLWTWGRVDAAVENVLDRAYANPMGGAYVGQGPSMSTSSAPWGVAVPGPARSFNVAVSFNFDSRAMEPRG